MPEIIYNCDMNDFSDETEPCPNVANHIVEDSYHGDELVLCETHFLLHLGLDREYSVPNKSDAEVVSLYNYEDEEN